MRSSCRGASITPGYRRIHGDSDRTETLGFEVQFQPPVGDQERTLTYEYTSLRYFASDDYHEMVHIALPTERSIMKYRFPEGWQIAAETTRRIEPLREIDEDMGNRHFTRAVPSEIKWEMPDPKFMSFYRIGFTVIRPSVSSIPVGAVASAQLNPGADGIKV